MLLYDKIFFRNVLSGGHKMYTQHKRYWAEVNLDAAENNFNVIKSHLNKETKLCCVIKADGYGHGAVSLAKLYEKIGADYFAGGDFTLGNLNRAVHHIGADDRIQKRAAALVGGKIRQLPEPSVEKRKGGDGMVAGGDRHHPALGASSEIALFDDKHARPFGKLSGKAGFKNESVVAHVEGLEFPRLPHRDGLHRAGAPGAAGFYPVEKAANGGHLRFRLVSR